jgi:anti-sigma factor RsiW
MTTHEQFDELAAGHALHALEPADEQLFLTHLETCRECQQSLAEFSELAAGLAITSLEDDDVAPPPALWAGIKAHVSDDTVTPIRHRQPRRWTAVGSVAAALVLLTAGVLSWQVLRGGANGTSVQTALRDCHKTSGCVAVPLTGASIRARSTYLMIEGQDVRVATNALPSLDASHTYVLWQMPQDGRPVGVIAFATDARGKTTIVRGTLPLPYDGTTAFAISREAGTTIPSAPSTPIVIGAATSA